MPWQGEFTAGRVLRLRAAFVSHNNTLAARNAIPRRANKTLVPGVMWLREERVPVFFLQTCLLAHGVCTPPHCDIAEYVEV